MFNVHSQFLNFTQRVNFLFSFLKLTSIIHLNILEFENIVYYFRAISYFGICKIELYIGMK